MEGRLIATRQTEEGFPQETEIIYIKTTPFSHQRSHSFPDTYVRISGRMFYWFFRRKMADERFRNLWRSERQSNFKRTYSILKKTLRYSVKINTQETVRKISAYSIYLMNVGITFEESLDNFNIFSSTSQMQGSVSSLKRKRSKYYFELSELTTLVFFFAYSVLAWYNSTSSQQNVHDFKATNGHGFMKQTSILRRKIFYIQNL